MDVTARGYMHATFIYGKSIIHAIPLDFFLPGLTKREYQFEVYWLPDSSYGTGDSNILYFFCTLFG